MLQHPNICIIHPNRYTLQCELIKTEPSPTWSSDFSYVDCQESVNFFTDKSASSTTFITSILEVLQKSAPLGQFTNFPTTYTTIDYMSYQSI